MGSINKQISRYEFTAVYSHPDAKVDIVLVHGLNGNPEKTWTAKNGVYWPTDLLPASLRNTHANVLVYGFNADVYSSRNNRSASNNFIHQHAQTLVTSLTHYRKSEESMRNPIIWVAHSLGGVLTKRALLYSNDVRADYHEDYRSIFVSTYGIIFLGTPHTGSDIATWGHVLQSMSDAVVPKRFFDTEPVLLKTLKRDNETLQAINSHFLDIYQRFRIHMAHENHKTDVKGGRVMVVDAASASPQLPGVTYYGIEASHSSMCKFDGPNAPGWRTVSTAIREWVIDAPMAVQIRWKVEDDDRALRANLESFERLRPYERATPASTQPEIVAENNNEMIKLSPEASPAAIAAPAPMPLLPETITELSEFLESQPKMEPIFIHPEQFRPNSFFVGREDEMRNLHHMLKDRKRRSEGTSAVLIQCLPGGGKTHLAREYVFQHRKDYPGGVYWVRAKSEQEIEYWYWRIAKNEALRGLLEQEDEAELRNPKKITAVVKRWLNSQEDWLLVLDGIQFDMPGIEDFIPDAKNTSLIYTSTERAVTGDYRFDNPQVIELGLPSPQSAQELLLLEMAKKQPWTQDDKARALELVQLMGRLPLMIHVAAQHLKATREPLSKYLRSYKTRPKVGDLPAYKAVKEQLEHRGANAALNLISILAFFGQHIPVEMVTLGLSALNNITPIKTPDASHRKTTLNNTLKILMAFALVERTDTDDMSATSSQSSTKNSVEKNTGYLDLLRIHSVVQAFFIDTLVEERQVQFWLERAVAVWCRSYDEADRRIEDGKVGLPDDYRRFSIHGKRLAENLMRFERRAPELLLPAREDVELRLEKIQHKIERLSHTYQSQIIDGSGEIPAASVFERSSSASETDSAITPPSQNSMTNWVPALGDYGDTTELLQSPTSFGPSDQPNPYHWHIPYPHQQLLMPSSPDPDNEDAKTVVPGREQTQLLATSDGTGADTAKNFLNPKPRPAIPEFERPLPHRVIRKSELRRYHDRAGAWRDRTVSDPRVSISREIAKGSISSISKPKPRSPSWSIQSGAETELNKIHRIAPPMDEAGQLLDDIGANRTRSASFSRPQSILGKNTYADALASKAVEEGSAVFSSGLAKIVSAPSSWTTATLKLLKENLHPVPVPPEGVVEVAVDPSITQRSHDSEALIAPGPIFRGTRTTNSSPANRSSPFAPPLASEMAPVPFFQQGITPTMQHWDTAAFFPSLDRLDSSSLVVGHEPMSLSFPTPSHAGPYNQQMRAHIHPWVTMPRGYSSQPMSRDASRKSSDPSSANHTLSVLSRDSKSSVGPSPLPAYTTNHSSPVGDSHSAGASPTKSHRFLLHSRTRRPSYTETEPSPRLEAAFPDIDTSYDRWGETSNAIHRHDRAGSGTDSVLGEGPEMGLPETTGGSLPVQTRWRFIRRGTRSRMRGPERSQSQSPVPSTRRLRSPFSPRLSPEIADSQARYPKSNNASGQAVWASSGDQAGGGGGKSMGRIGSGGITVGDGRIVEFGMPLPQEVQSSPRSLERGSMSKSTSRNSSNPGGQVGLGIQQSRPSMK